MKKNTAGLFLGCLYLVLVTAQAPSVSADDRNWQEMHQATEKSYRLTEVTDRKNASIRQARSRPVTIRNFKILGPKGLVEYYIVSDLVKATGESTSKIVIKTYRSEAVLESAGALPASQRQTSGARKHQWNGYTVRYFGKSSATELTAAHLKGRTGKSRSGSFERLEIPIATSDLAHPIKFGSGIHIILHSEISAEMTLELPFTFLIGYFTKMSGDGFLPASDQARIDKLKDAIEGKAAN